MALEWLRILVFSSHILANPMMVHMPVGERGRGYLNRFLVQKWAVVESHIGVFWYLLCAPQVIWNNNRTSIGHNVKVDK